MTLISHTKQFLIKAAMHAKHQRMKELNSLEGDLIYVETLVHDMKGNSPERVVEGYLKQIGEIRNSIKEKKLKLI